MRRINFIEKESSRYFKTQTGKMFNFVPFDCKINVDKGLFLCCGDSDYKKSTFQTVFELCESGEIVECFPLKSYTVIDNGQSIDRIISEFRENGFEVTEDAITHNMDAWNNDEKSGFRGKDFHLFSPCGCNKLSFTATTLSELCDEWQTTYRA